MASRLVFEHKVPYRDFFFTQMPLLPYVYGLWMQVAGTTWIAARALSAFFTMLLGAAMYVHVCKETGRWTAGLVAVVLFVSSTYVFGWFPAVKTYALSSLLLFGAYAGIAGYSSRYPRMVFALGGLLLGLSVDARLYFAGLLPLLILWVFTSPEVRERRAALLWLLGGFALAVLPNLYLFALAPDAYVFGNIGLHSVRSGEGLIGDRRQAGRDTGATSNPRRRKWLSDRYSVHLVGASGLSQTVARDAAGFLHCRSDYPDIFAAHALARTVLLRSHPIPDRGRDVFGERPATAIAKGAGWRGGWLWQAG